ncbi:MAG: rod shape-determining protein MreC [Cytophagaceae bacterium]|nr:MAG: rod shape-determining protein MreC [Cytophagaceae bacterium]
MIVLVMQIIALSFLFRYNKFHEAAFMGVANELTGRVSSRYSNVEYYFRLKKINESLAQQNEQLLNQLKNNYQGADSLTQVVIDTVNKDTSGIARRYLWRGARVVNNSVSLQNNYLTIHRGERQGVRKDMGVISPQGIVGMVVNTSENFSVVMTMLNRQSSVSAKIKNSGEIGKVLWDGKSPGYVTMENIPKSVKLVKGDSVVTSGYSLSFPPGILIGTVNEIIDDKTSNFYSLKLQPSTNFYSVEYVTVVDNLQKDEQKRLEEATRKNQ